MQIEDGKFYKAVDGTKVGPMHCHENIKKEYATPWYSTLYGAYYDSGVHLRYAERDLIEEWKDEPKMTVDLSKNTTPWGLLDEETKAAFKAWDGKFEFWVGKQSWLEVKSMAWSSESVYRTVPKPVVETRNVRIVDNMEGWVVAYANLDFKDDEPVWESFRDFSE